MRTISSSGTAMPRISRVLLTRKGISPRRWDPPGVLIDHPPANRPPGKLRHESGRPVQRPDQPFRIDPPFEPESGIGPHGQFPRRSADGGGIEIGALQENHLRVLFHLGVETAHDPSDGHRFDAVTDHQGVAPEEPLLPVEGDEPLALPGPPDHDLPLFQEAEIKGMQGLSQFHHHEIGHIHYIVDRTKPHRLQPLSHPEGGRSDPDILDDPRRIPRTEVRIEDGNGGDSADIFIGLDYLGGGIAHLTSP